MTERRPSAPNPEKIVWMIGGFALLIRLFCLVYFRSYTSLYAGFASGYENGFISRSLAESRGFGSPFGGETGPTAWIAPLYPALQALVFKVFGIETVASAIAMRTINIATAPMICMLLYRIASRVWNRGRGIAAAAAWAIFPDSIWYDSTMVWDTVLATLLFLILLDMVISRDESATNGVRFGVVGGALALLNPALLSGVAMCLAWKWRTSKAGTRWLLFAVLTMTALVTPWLVRNYLVFVRPVFIRDNFGHELFKGNHLVGDFGGYIHPPATGENDWSLNPYNNPVELQRYRELGEIGYVADHKRLAIQAIRKYPFWVLKLVRRRVDFFWNGPVDVKFIIIQGDAFLPAKRVWYSAVSLCGMLGVLVSLLRREAFAALFASIVLAYPLVYYITFCDVRYRFPIEPILLLYGLHLGRITIAYLARRLAAILPPKALDIGASSVPDFS